MSGDAEMPGIRLATDGDCRLIEISRPSRRNALRVADRFAIRDALVDADADPSVRSVLITGAGEHFCSGGDINEFAQERSAEEARAYAGEVAQAVFRTMRTMRTPTIAGVRGAAVGAGMALALGCDLVVAERDAYFMAAQLNLGVIPDWGLIWLLPRLIGIARAKALLLPGHRIGAEDAAAIGMIAACVESDRLEQTIADYRARIAAAPALATGLTRAGLDASLDTSADRFLDWEARAIAQTMSSTDHRDRVAAFLSGR